MSKLPMTSSLPNCSSASVCIVAPELSHKSGQELVASIKSRNAQWVCDRMAGVYEIMKSSRGYCDP